MNYHQRYSLLLYARIPNSFGHGADFVNTFNIRTWECFKIFICLILVTCRFLNLTIYLYCSLMLQLQIYVTIFFVFHLISSLFCFIILPYCIIIILFYLIALLLCYFTLLYYYYVILPYCIIIILFYLIVFQLFLFSFFSFNYIFLLQGECIISSLYWCSL